VLGALAGNPSCELVLVDIAAGREAADLCMAARAWEKRSDVFSVANISETEAVVGTATPVVSDEPQEVAADPTAAATPAPTQAEIVARLRRHPNIDEGVVADPEQLDRTFARMIELYIGLDVAAKSWMGNLQGDAQRAGCGFHASERHTLRRFELIRGLIALAAAELDDDDLIRHLVEHATGDDVAQFPTVRPGHVLGAMDAAEASRFALACDALAADQIALTFSDAGRPLFIAAA
jgi:predicted nucleic acid-binding protein